MSGHDRRDDVAALLVGGLPPGEAAELERHLAGCEECLSYMRWLEPAARLIPEGVERRDPPPGLGERIRDAVAPAPARRPLLAGRRPLAALAAAAVLLAAVAGYAIRGGDSGQGERTVMAGATPGASASVVRMGDVGMLRLTEMRPLPPGHVLEAWVKREGRVVPVRGLFVPDRDGRATAMIPDMTGVEAVMVTVEPRGGSVHPTSRPMVTARIENG